MNEVNGHYKAVKENFEKHLGEISPVANVYLCICDRGQIRSHSLLNSSAPHKAIGDLTSVIECYRADITKATIVNTVIAQAKKPKIFGAFGGAK